MKTTLLLSLLVGLMFTSCDPKKSSARLAYSSGTVRSNIDYGNGGTGVGVFTNTCGNTQAAWGSIYDSTYSYDFENRVKSFLSAAVNPNEIGSISPGPADITGVRFQGTIKVDSNGQINLAMSKISIKVYDSFVSYSNSSNQYQPIAVEINTASEGQFNPSTGVGYVVYKDSYGEIRFDGKLDAQFFQGQVSYKNYRTVLPNASPASGNLGQFYIARCGIIQ